MVTPCNFPTAQDELRALQTLKCEAKSLFIFVLEHAPQKRPSPHAGQAGGGLAKKVVGGAGVRDELRPSICPTVFELVYLIGMH